MKSSFGSKLYFIHIFMKSICKVMILLYQYATEDFCWPVTGLTTRMRNSMRVVY